MKKSDLRTGYRVTTRSGKKYTVLIDAVNVHGTESIFASKGGFNYFSHYDDDLRCRSENKNYDIVKVEVPCGPGTTLKDNDNGFITLWVRPEPKEMTLAEIEAALGYPVKIIERSND